MEPLGWDEIVSQPGMGGYLSFLNGPVPLPHLQGAVPAPATGPAIDKAPGVDSTSRAESSPDVIKHPAIETIPVAESAPEITDHSGLISHPGVDSVSGSQPIPHAITNPISALAPVVVSAPESNAAAWTPSPATVSIPGVISTPVERHFRIRRCAATHDGHSLGEEVLYQALWKAAAPEEAETRTIVIGWRGMSQLCRMTPKNCKINTQRLVRKLALEILSPYNTPESIGTTYRIYSDAAILERRREAGLEWVIRSRGVDFVDPATGSSIMPICAQTSRNMAR